MIAVTHRRGLPPLIWVFSQVGVFEDRCVTLGCFDAQPEQVTQAACVTAAGEGFVQDAVLADLAGCDPDRAGDVSRG